ncbi:MAG: OsmC family protein [Moraxella osloensis]|nr:OsmC family protein [Moraxella osloensis]
MGSMTTVKWIDNRTMLAQTPSGHGLIMDGAPDIGGQNLGPRPMEMILAGLGGCTSVDVQMILEKTKQDFRNLEIQITSERAEDHPKVYTKIHLHFVVTGKDLDPKKVERAISLSAEKYCSVNAMLKSTAEITHDFEIVDVAH